MLDVEYMSKVFKTRSSSELVTPYDCETFSNGTKNNNQSNSHESRLSVLQYFHVFIFVIQLVMKLFAKFQVIFFFNLHLSCDHLSSLSHVMRQKVTSKKI